jgi:hypothetical protein
MENRIAQKVGLVRSPGAANLTVLCKNFEIDDDEFLTNVANPLNLQRFSNFSRQFVSAASRRRLLDPSSDAG